MRLTRRDLLLGTGAMGLAACGPRTPQTRALELWTLQLAPKFNPYFADVLGAWGGEQLHPRCGGGDTVDATHQTAGAKNRIAPTDALQRALAELQLLPPPPRRAGDHGSRNLSLR